jgi:hypothetical protein
MPRKLRPCGTPAAYARHLNRGEKPCADCRAANAATKSGSGDAALRVGEIAMAKALDANPPVIVWRKRRNGVFEAVSVDDPHTDTNKRFRNEPVG